MSKNITLLGNSYSDVGYVELPKTGGGTARYDDASVTTATAGDVAQGKVFVASDGTITTGTASGGGGASNIVQGTFKYDSYTSATIDLPYTGTGYPVAIIITPQKGSYNPDDPDFYNLVSVCAIEVYCATKSRADVSPRYNGGSQANDGFTVQYRYKQSSTSATAYSQTASNQYVVCSQGAPANNNQAVVRMPSATKLRLVTQSSNTSYGFANGVTYAYTIIYSS